MRRVRRWITSRIPKPVANFAIIFIFPILSRLVYVSGRLISSRLFWTDEISKISLEIENDFSCLMEIKVVRITHKCERKTTSLWSWVSLRPPGWMASGISHHKTIPDLLLISLTNDWEWVEIFFRVATTKRPTHTTIAKLTVKQKEKHNTHINKQQSAPTPEGGRG